MEITISSMGHNKGTSGWLKTEIESDRMEFREGVSKTGRTLLYLVRNDGERKKSMPLAEYDPLDNSFIDGEEGKYEVLNVAPDFLPNSTSNIFDLTPAALRSVLSVAEKWCEKKNSERENDESFEIEVTFK